MIHLRLLVLFVFVFTAAGCDRSAGERIVFDGKTMGTTYRIILIPDKKRPTPHLATGEIKREVQKTLDLIEELMSTWKPESELSRFNQLKSNEPFIVSPLTAKVIAESVRIHKSSGGLFDPGIDDLIELWGFGKTEFVTPPAPEKIKEVLLKSGIKNLKINGNTLQKTNPGLRLNLSAVAKGFAVDQVYEKLRELGFQSLLVEVGGEVRAGDQKPDQELWNVGIEKPQYENETQKIYAVAALANLAMATSGDYRNFYLVNGKRVAHILDPRTGYPSDTHVISASVIGPSCMTADALATALSVMRVADGLKMIESMPDYEAMLLREEPDGKITEHKSPGFGAYLKR